VRAAWRLDANPNLAPPRMATVTLSLALIAFADMAGKDQHFLMVAW